MSQLVANLLKRYDIISEQIEPRELSVILRACETALRSAKNDVAIVEFGCYEGTTSLFLQRLIQVINHQTPFHVYDSFAGLPSKTDADMSAAGEQFVKGALKASKQTFIRHFKQAHLPLPVIHKGWFDAITPAEVPADIIFAFLDGDYFESVTSSLKLIWPKLLPGAIVVVDDYQNEALPGARRAVDDWLQAHPAQLRVEASLAIIKR